MKPATFGDVVLRLATSMYRPRMVKAAGMLALCLAVAACAAVDGANPGPRRAGPANAATAIAASGDTVWDYVALGDSTPAGAGVSRSYVGYYAEYIAEDLGVLVRVQNWAKDGQTTAILLDELKTNPRLRAALGQAEVITIWIGWNDMGLPLALFRESKCGGANGVSCIRDAADTVSGNFDAILDEILALRGDEDTLIRVADLFNPFVDAWKQQGAFELLKEAGFEEWRANIARSAAERGVTVIQTYAALNGPDGQQPVSGRGLMQADGLHFNDDGHRLIAQLHREAGYAFPIP